MRLGLCLHDRREAEEAKRAEEFGLFGVFAGAGDPMLAIIAATYAATATEFVRIIARVRLGLEHPITLAEELSILDNVSNGRTVALVDAGDLDEGAAAEELQVIREGLSCRPVQHDGLRWRVPARLPANDTGTESVMVTPKPTQIEIPVWITGAVADPVGRTTGLPVLAAEPGQCSHSGMVQPGIVEITGGLAADLEQMALWVNVGTTHLLLTLPPAIDFEQTMTMIARHLAPEVGMPHYPRIVSNVKVPLPWPKAEQTTRQRSADD